MSSHNMLFHVRDMAERYCDAYISILFYFTDSYMSHRASVLYAFYSYGRRKTFSDVLVKIQLFSLKKMLLKVAVMWPRHQYVNPHEYANITHYGDVIVDVLASQITSLTIVYSTVHSDADQRKHQSSASLVFVRGIHG